MAAQTKANTGTTYVILGAGVIGLTTALELKERFPHAEVAIVAKFVPGDRNVEFCSPWAGANWCSMATDNGPQEARDAITYRKFAALSKSHPSCGLQLMPFKALFDSSLEQAGVLSQGTGKVWYDSLVGGLRWLERGELKGAKCGFEFQTWMIDVSIYLGWLYHQVLAQGVQVQRLAVDDIRELFTLFPTAKAIFNCAGLGSYSLKGVEDKKMYPSRGQTVLISHPPSTPINRMYIRSPKRVFKDTTYVFPRNPRGGIVLGGCRADNEWNGEPSVEFADDIIRRCVELVPDLGTVEEVKKRVVSVGVGLRPCREGGARLEREEIQGRTVVHNYGAAGAGYQASWGLAKDAVDLVEKQTRL